LLAALLITVDYAKINDQHSQVSIETTFGQAEEYVQDKAYIFMCVFIHSYSYTVSDK